MDGAGGKAFCAGGDVQMIREDSLHIQLLSAGPNRFRLPLETGAEAYSRELSCQFSEEGLAGGSLPADFFFEERPGSGADCGALNAATRAVACSGMESYSG